MKLFLKIAKRFRQKCERFTTLKYKLIDVRDFPKDIKSATIYIVTNEAIPDTLIFKCPCGCNADIYLNLLEDVRPRWKYIITKQKITVSPSVWRITGCRSHFFIKKSKA